MDIEMIGDGKSPGCDELYPEVIKRESAKLLCDLHEIIQEAWNTATVPQNWNDTQLFTIFKKADLQICSNYKGISLLLFLKRFLHKFYSANFYRMLKASYPRHSVDSKVEEVQ